MNNFKKLIILVPVVFGIAIMAYMKGTKKAPVRMDKRERIHSVRVISVNKTTVIPRIKGYGYAQSEKKWEAISEVSGKVVEVNPNLKRGFFIRKGESLLKIDTATYGLAETRGKADVLNVDAQLKELAQSEKNTQRLLEIEKKSLAISARELERKRELFEKGYASKSDFEKEERTFLSQQTTVNNLQNTLDLIPSRKKALLAQKTSGESTVTEKRLDIEKTEIFAPFNCRLSAVNIELDQFAAVGTVLLEAESIDAAEVPVQLSPKDFMKILPKADDPLASDNLSMDTIREAIGIKAMVRLPLDDDKNIEWEGRFSRTSESMDVKTGTLTVYITVDAPYGELVPGRRPPLVSNMYVEVELWGRPLSNRFVIPRSSVHSGNVYIAGPDNRLVIKPVSIDFYMDDIAVLSKSLDKGERLILTDLMPAVQGMLLAPVGDDESQARLARQATGEGL